jgi:adenylylsulfate kinase
MEILPERPRLLRLDDIRKQIAPEPRYTSEERETVYAVLADTAHDLVESGTSVIVDATAHEARWRQRARDAIPDYLEVRIDCPLEECIRREGSRPEGRVMADIYRRALQRKETGADHPGLGEVIGVDVQYEGSEDAFHADSVANTPEENAAMILAEMRARCLIS